MDPQALIIHERLAYWAGRLRPRFRGWPIRWSETRSTAELVEAAGRPACPILVVDLGDRPARGLADLDAANQAAPTALSLVLDPADHPGVAAFARELGATLVFSGPVVPPAVEAILERWLPLARRRAEGDGWARPSGPEPEFWERPELFALADRRQR